jgi:hypothetical protein
MIIHRAAPITTGTAAPISRSSDRPTGASTFDFQVLDPDSGIAIGNVMLDINHIGRHAFFSSKCVNFGEGASEIWSA